MADIVRDVVVRITLEQIQATLKAPDVSPYTKSQEEISKSLKKVEADAVKTAGVTKQANEETANDMKKWIKEVSTANDKAVKADIELKKKQADEQKKLADQAAAAADKQISAQLRVLEATKQVGTGTFQLARGFAFLSTSTDENFQKMLQTIAKFQGGFDIIAGGVDVIKGMVEGTMALKSAYGVATVAAGLQAAAQTAVTATAATATAAVTALKVALGPIGLIVTGIGVGVAALAAGWKVLTAEQEKVAQSTLKVSEEQKKINAGLEREYKLRSDLRQIEQSAASKKIGRLDGEEKVAAINDASAKNKIEIEQLESRIELAKRFRDEQIKIAENSKKQGGLLKGAALLSGAGFQTTEGNSLEAGDAVAARDAAARANTQILEETRILAQLTSQEVQNKTELADIAKRTADQKEAQLEKEKMIVEEAKKGVETAKQRLAVEESKLQTEEARFGALSKQEQAEAFALAEKAKAGQELNRLELQRLSQLGGASAAQFVQDQQSQAGREAGFSRFDELLGGTVNAGVEQARAGIEDAKRKQAEAESRAQEATALLESATAEYGIITDLLRGLIDKEAELIKQVRELEEARQTNEGQDL